MVHLVPSRRALGREVEEGVDRREAILILGVVGVEREHDASRRGCVFSKGRPNRRADVEFRVAPRLHVRWRCRADLEECPMIQAERVRRFHRWLQHRCHHGVLEWW